MGAAGNGLEQRTTQQCLLGRASRALPIQRPVDWMTCATPMTHLTKPHRRWRSCQPARLRQSALAGEATFSERYADDAVDYLYGVSECDPFGRWSAFITVPFRWDNLTPPLTPAQVTANLEESGMPLVQVVTVRFAWPLDLADPAGMTFDVHLRRMAPLSATPVSRAAWGRFERVDGTLSPAFLFPPATPGPLPMTA